MGRRKHKFSGKFVMVTEKLLKDPEWRKLSSSAKIIWLYLRLKFNFQTLNEVSLAYSEIEDMFSSATISSAFKELVKTGFIEKVKHGGLFGGVSSYKFIGPHKDFYYNGHKI